MAQALCELELVVMAGFILIFRFTGYFMRRAGLMVSAGRRQENIDEEYETRLTATSCQAFEGGMSLL